MCFRRLAVKFTEAFRKTRYSMVLRYMGILTVMKLSVFAISILSLLIAFTWVLIYCPVGVFKNAVVVEGNQENPNVHNTRNRQNIVEYFEEYDAQISEDIKNPVQVADKVVPVKSEGNGAKTMNKDVSKTSKLSDVVPMHLYNDDAFDSMIDQLENKDIKGYEFLAESTNVTIYRQPRGNAGLYQYKLYATLPDATPDEITAVFLDNEYRLVWDTYVTELYPVKLNDNGPDIIYFNVDFPWPLANRDYVYARESRKQLKNGKEYITIVMHSVLKDNIPHVKSVIRVNDYHQSLALKKWGKRGTKAYIQYYDDPKGSIPSWLVNWAAKTGVPAFLKDLQRACRGLEAFLETKHRPMLSVKVY